MSNNEVTISFKGNTIKSEKGSNLRKELLKHHLSPYNGKANFFNCKGMGTCGTCALEIKGVVSAKTKVEKWRLNFPPHTEGKGLRLACQCRVWGNLELEKYSGFWGQNKP